MATTHNCAARGCTVKVPSNLLMCNAHWRLVPPATQARVWRAFAERGNKPDAPVTQTYVDALLAAVNSIPKGV